MNLSAVPLRKYYIWGLKALIFVIPFLSLWIATSYYFPYITARNFAFRILVELALALWLGLMAIDKSYRPKFTVISGAILVFVIVVAFADILGVNFYKSFWSNFERMEGLITILHLAAYFLITTSIFKVKKDWLVFFNLFVVAGLLVGAYGFLQVLGLKEAIQGGGNRMDGTIGNPTYFAVYLVLILGIISILFCNAQNRAAKYFYGISAGYCLFILYFTASRGAALAMFVSIPIFAALYLFFYRKDPDPRRKLYKKIAAGIIVLTILTPIAVKLMNNVSFVKESPTLSRLASTSLGERTVKSRFLIWDIAWQAFKERPLLGWGQENFLQAFSKYYHPGLYRQEPWFDRAHNIVMDWLVNGGILGLLAYFAIWLALYFGIFRLLYTRKVSKSEGIVLLVGPMAYFIQNLFVFDNINTYILFFTFLAYVNFLIRQDAIISEQESVPSAKIIESGIAIAVIVAALIGGYYVNWRPASQARAIIQGLIATTDRDDPFTKTYDEFKKALNYNTFGNAEVLEQLSQTTSALMDQGGVSGEIKLRYLDFFSSEAEKYLEKFPNDIRMHLFLAEVYQRSSQFDPSKLIKARDRFKIGLKLSPQKQQIITALANNYLINQEVEKAMELLDLAISLDESNLEALGNKAFVAVLLQRTDLVQEVINKMTALQKAGWRDPSDEGLYLEQLARIGAAYMRVKGLANARLIYEQLLKLKPDNEDYRRILEDIKLAQNQ